MTIEWAIAAERVMPYGHAFPTLLAAALRAGSLCDGDECVAGPSVESSDSCGSWWRRQPIFATDPASSIDWQPATMSGTLEVVHGDDFAHGCPEFVYRLRTTAGRVGLAFPDAGPRNAVERGSASAVTASGAY
jgi:hypothetical protein